MAIATERDIKVVTQKPRQRHVPATPEFDDICRFIGRVEVERQLDAEQTRQTDRHVGIAGEIKIELKGIGQRTTPSGKERQAFARLRRGKHRAAIGRDTVSQHYLLEQTERENSQPDDKIFDLGRVILRLCKLRHHFLVMQHGPRNQMRKVGDKQKVVDKVCFFGDTAMDIHQVGNLRKREKRNAERQNDIQQRRRRRRACQGMRT